LKPVALGAAGCTLLWLALSVGGDWHERAPFARLPVPHLDLWARMRGWTEALSALAPLIRTHPERAVIANRRDLLAHGGYVLRDQELRWIAWNPEGKVRSHFDLATRMPSPGDTAAYWLLTKGAPAESILHRFARARRVAAAGAERVQLELWEVQGFTPAAGATR
jgi:hypothetical protein